MCVVSMVMDHYRDKWTQPYYIPYSPLVPSQEEIDEFRKLLERARKYDKANNQPDCELDEKRLALKKIADELGIDISFIGSPSQNISKNTEKE